MAPHDANELMEQLHATLSARAQQVYEREKDVWASPEAWENGVYRALVYEILTENWPRLKQPNGAVIAYDTPEKATRFLFNVTHKEYMAEAASKPQGNGEQH